MKYLNDYIYPFENMDQYLKAITIVNALFSENEFDYYNNYAENN